MNITKPREDSFKEIVVTSIRWCLNHIMSGKKTLKFSNSVISDLGRRGSRGMFEQRPDFKENFRVEDKEAVMVSTDICFNTFDWSQREPDKEVNSPSGKEPACQCRRCRFDPWVRKIPEEGHVNPFQYPCLGNPMDKGAWQAIVHGVSKELDTT